MSYNGKAWDIVKTFREDKSAGNIRKYDAIATRAVVKNWRNLMVQKLCDTVFDIQQQHTTSVTPEKLEEKTSKKLNADKFGVLFKFERCYSEC